MTEAKRPAEPGATPDETEGFTATERAAMKERAQELKSQSRRGSRGKAQQEADVLAKIAEMPEEDRVLAERFHAVVTASAPDLAPKLWYGMPAYAKDGKVLCFFQGAQKFETRYSAFGFNDVAKLDDGNLWPTSFALVSLTDAEEKTIGAMVRRAAGED